jgi:hypothetical protein
MNCATPRLRGNFLSIAISVPSDRSYPHFLAWQKEIPISIGVLMRGLGCPNDCISQALERGLDPPKNRERDQPFAVEIMQEIVDSTEHNALKGTAMTARDVHAYRVSHHKLSATRGWVS